MCTWIWWQEIGILLKPKINVNVGYDLYQLQKEKNIPLKLIKSISIIEKKKERNHLDEATSNLDTESEAFIQKSLAQLVQGRTTIVITHLLITIKQTEQILVKKVGSIAGRGTHETLIAQKWRYYNLYNQAKI